MYTEKLQKQRFELKYLINEQQAQNIRHFVQSYLTIDEYGATQPQLSYPVHSLYLDSPAFKTYFDTINGNRNRFKLRIRYYEKDNEDTAFLELKQRYDRIIAKKRAKVPVKSLDELIFGPLPSMDQFSYLSKEQFKSLHY
ncbi:MAG: VTC domain-containing protein, partial [Gracilimonas sp.]